MVSGAITTIAEYLASLGLDAARDKANHMLDEKGLHSALTTYVEKQRKYNEICSLAEEIDFQGLVEYIQDNLIDDVMIRIFDPNRKKRAQARQDIVNAAVTYSKVSTQEAMYRVSKCISICLDIIHSFYKSHQFSVKDYVLSDMIVDAVAEEVHEAKSGTVDALYEAKDQIIARIDERGALFSIDKAVELAENGNIGMVSKGIKSVLNHVSLTHPYAPNFRYDYTNGMIISKPLTPEATKLYPSKMVLTGTLKIGDHYYSDPNGDPLNYAYRHQLPIILEVSKAKKLLGEKLDPTQDEVTGLVGNTVIATPPAFPPAFPCSIRIKNTTFFNYVLLRTQEILDNGIFVLGNKGQGSPLYLEIRIDFDNPSKSSFKINMDNANHHELLNYVRFMDTLSKEKEICIYELSHDREFITGYINDINYKTGFATIDEEIDFLERICTIEDFFNVYLKPQDKISVNEYKAILHISDLIRNDEVLGSWDEATLTGTLDKHFREELINMKDEQYMFAYDGTAHIDLFGTGIDYSFERTLKCAQIVDLERVKRKAEVLDDGDNIRIILRAGKDKGTIEKLKILKGKELSSSNKPVNR